MNKTPRSCLICRDMICGCTECYKPNSLRTAYGLCKTCIRGIGVRVGEIKSAHANDETKVRFIKYANPQLMFRTRRKLEEWSRA